MAANPGPPPSTAQPQGGNTGDVELTTTDEVKEYCHEGDGENDEYLNSMDLHDIKSELEKDAEQAETPNSNSLVASSSSSEHTNPTNTSINSQTIQFRPTVVLPYGQSIGIPYGYPTSFMSSLPIDQNLRSSYPFLMPGQYVTQMPYAQQQLSLSFGTTPIAPNAAVHPHSGMIVPQQKEKKPHIKKPLNAFMLFMKEKRAEVMKDRTLKESAAINQILGKMWHKLDKSEQAKYYEMAREERAKHMQMYPGWSARDNYAVHKKRKKKKSTKQTDIGSEDGYVSDSDCTSGNPQKCRARFGLEQQDMWCFGCRKKKKCIRSNGENTATVPFSNPATVKLENS